MYQSKNPYTGETIRGYATIEDGDIQQCLAAAEDAYTDWRTTSFAKRADIIRRVAELMRQQTDACAQWATWEMGKPITQARAEIEKCAWLCEYFAENAEAFLQEKKVSDEDLQARIWYQPMGAVLGVMPWNYPYWQAIRYAIPNIMAGNVVLLKPASNVPKCGLEIERLLREAGAPKGVFQTVLIDSQDTEKLIKERIVCGVTLTGSGPAGATISSLASKHLKRSVLELGGSDAFIVLDDADVEKAAQIAIKSRFTNNGQTCIASKRWIVMEKVVDAFTTQVSDRIQALPVGDPMQDDTIISCMARPDLLEDLDEQVESSLKEGAQALIRGGDDGQGHSTYLPTLLKNIPTGSPAYSEELFGPVACLFSVPDEAAAIALANESAFGLGAAVWSQDTERALRVARELEAGALSINQMVSSDPRLPFGGVKDSGFGREMGETGIKEFVNVKAVKLN